MSKKTLILLIALVVLVAALVTVYFVTRPETTDETKQFTLEIVHSDGSLKKVPMESNYRYLGEYLQRKRIIKGEEGPYGLYIKEVEGERAVFEEDNAYWGFYVDGEYAMLGIDQTPIEDGKVYRLAYTVDNQ